MIDLKEFSGYLRIDKRALDNELIQQPEVFYKVAEAVAEAIAERDTSKEKLALVDAELDGETRNELDQQAKKYTEAMVRNAIQTSKKHRAAFTAYTAAKTMADKLLAMKEAFSQRNFALRELCNLYVANYYQQDSVRGTGATDRVQYNVRRSHLAEERAKRQG